MSFKKLIGSNSNSHSNLHIQEPKNGFFSRRLSIKKSKQETNHFYNNDEVVDETSKTSNDNNPFDSPKINNDEEFKLNNNEVIEFDADHIKETYEHEKISNHIENDQASGKTTSTITSNITINEIEAPKIRRKSKINNKAKSISNGNTVNVISNKEEIEFNLPFGDGSNKIFGMENFGATCYCNSIVQSLYYTPLFRKFILSLPSELNDELNNKEPKLIMNGSKTHHFLTAIQNNKVDVETGEFIGKDEEVKETPIVKNEKPGRKMSFFGSKKDRMEEINHDRHDSAVSQESTDSKESSSSTSTNNLYSITPEGHLQYGDRTIFRAISNYEGLRNLKLGYQVPNKNVTVVGVVDDPNATSEQRKRKALINGPILNIDESLTVNKSSTMFDALKDIFECMVENENQIGVVSPNHLMEVLKKENELFRSLMHQDAHEFFNHLINSVFEQINNYFSKNNNESLKKFSNNLFEGLLTSQTKCLQCERISSRDEKFFDLSIDLENNTSITACLKQFSSNEILCEENKFYCENCSSLQEATKRMIIKKLPKILTLHLKRFKYSETSSQNIKLFHRVSYPLYLRLFNTIEIENDSINDDENKIYELYSVVVHIGGGPYRGHYVSCVKTEHSGWLLFDDETVESIDENYVLRFFGDGPGMASAYILFYKEISEEDYLNETLYKKMNFQLNYENELLNEINYQEQAPNFNIPDFSKRKNSSSDIKSTIQSPMERKKSVNNLSPPSTANSNEKKSKSINLKSPLNGSFKFGNNDESVTINEENGKRKSIFGFNKKKSKNRN